MLLDFALEELMALFSRLRVLSSGLVLVLLGNFLLLTSEDDAFLFRHVGVHVNVRSAV